MAFRVRLTGASKLKLDGVTYTSKSPAFEVSKDIFERLGRYFELAPDDLGPVEITVAEDGGIVVEAAERPSDLAEELATKHINDWTKAELQAFLKGQNIEFPTDASKEELLALVENYVYQ